MYTRRCASQGTYAPQVASCVRDHPRRQRMRQLGRYYVRSALKCLPDSLAARSRRFKPLRRSIIDRNYFAPQLKFPVARHGGFDVNAGEADNSLYAVIIVGRS